MQPKYVPGYHKILTNKILQKKVEQARQHLTNCNLCPHNCAVNRKEKHGFCRATDKVVLSSYGPHMGEEPSLVGRHGSGTIFFGYCNMRCVFCQNCELSFGGEGELVTNVELAKIMLELQNFFKCHNINLVTPTHFVPNILEAVLLAAEKGLMLPLVYNCGGYEKLETLKLLEDVIDIYMPDFKYNQSERGRKYSGIQDYPTIVQKSLKEMDRQVGGLKIDKQGIAYRGLLIRHLVMPGGVEDTKEILKFIKEALSPDCQVNLMEQYFPAHQAYQFEELSQRLSYNEYQEALAYARTLGLNLVG